MRKASLGIISPTGANPLLHDNLMNSGSEVPSATIQKRFERHQATQEQSFEVLKQGIAKAQSSNKKQSNQKPVQKKFNNLQPATGESLEITQFGASDHANDLMTT